MTEEHRWGFVIYSGRVPADADGEKDESTVDAVTVNVMSPAVYAIKLKAELARVQAELQACSGRAGNAAVEAAATVESASVDDILAVEAEHGSAVSTVGVIFDWKVEYLTPQVMLNLFTVSKVKAAILSRPTTRSSRNGGIVGDGAAGGGSGAVNRSRQSYTLGKTRPVCLTTLALTPSLPRTCSRTLLDCVVSR